MHALMPFLPSSPDNYILSTTLRFPDHISDEARRLINKMMVPDPKFRCSLEDVLKDP